MKPEISIVMANYNKGNFIGEAIRSVLDQTFTDWELIVVDDGSTDQSCEEISSFKDERIRLKKLAENGHLSNARNVGMTFCKGRYILGEDNESISSSASPGCSA